MESIRIRARTLPAVCNDIFRNRDNSVTYLVVCDATPDLQSCLIERYRIPIKDGIYPQSLNVKYSLILILTVYLFRSSGSPMYLFIDQQLPDSSMGYVAGDVDVLFRVHASVLGES